MNGNLQCRRVAALLSAAALFLSLPACQSSRELDDLAIVRGVGIDPDKNDPEKIQLTVQLVNPREISPANSESRGESGNAFLNISSTGSTVFEAVRDLNGRTSRTLFWPHNEILIIGRDAAEGGIRKYLDFFMRDHETRGKIQIAVSDCAAAEILNAENRLEQISAEETAAIIEEYAHTSAHAQSVRLNEFINHYMESGTGIMPILTVRDEDGAKFVDIRGMAVFCGEYMAGRLDDGESRGCMWINGGVKSGIVNIIDSAGGNVSLEIMRSSSRVSAEQRDGQISVSVDCHVTANIGEQSDTLDLSLPGELAWLKNAAEQRIEGEIVSAVRKSQSMSTDFLEFGTAIKRRYPGQWEKMADTWDEELAALQVDVNVTTELQLPGKIIRTPIPKGDEK